MRATKDSTVAIAFVARLIGVLAIAVACAATIPTFAAAQSQQGAHQGAQQASAKAENQSSLPPLPATGMDFTSIDAFWKVADQLVRNVEPPFGDWRTMLSTTGYRLSTIVVPTTLDDMEIALKPSHAAKYDSLTAKVSERGMRLQHFRAIVAHRDELAQCRDSIALALPVREAMTLASKYLPPGGTDRIPPPLVAFAYFRNDAYSLAGQGVIVDLDHVCEQGGLTLLLAHEFHHSYTSTFNELKPLVAERTDFGIANALTGMRDEGLADLIDKPHPLLFTSSAFMAAYAEHYNDAYDRTPAVIRSIDSALAVAAGDPSKLREVGVRVQALLPSNGHYNGSYVAREILETFGVDSLFPAVANPFALLRTYAAAEKQRGQPAPFSEKSIALLDQIERRYLKRADRSATPASAPAAHSP